MVVFPVSVLSSAIIRWGNLYFYLENLYDLIFSVICSSDLVQPLTHQTDLICGNKMPTRCNSFLLRILLLAQHVSGTTMPIIRSSRILYSGCCLWYFVLWFSSCCSGVELRVMCPVCRMIEVFVAVLIACSTCFGHHYAHQHELKSIIQ